MKNYYTMMFLSLTMISYIIAFSSKNWFILWISFEINMLGFIPLILKNSSLSISSMMKYFIIQSIGSSMFFFLMILNSYINFSMFLFINIPLMVKMGVFPFHFWVLDISEGLNYLILFILLTFQKLIPLYILNIFFDSSLFFFIFLNSIICSIMMFFFSSVRKIMILSSLTHISWILSSMIFSDNTWIFYLLFYMFILLPLFYIFKEMKINSIFQLNYCNTNLIVLIYYYFLSLAGIPPFLGFLLKWSILSKYSDWNMIQFLLIFSSILNSYIYTRMIFPFLMKNSLLKKKSLDSKNMLIFNLPMFIFIPMIFF